MLSVGDLTGHRSAAWLRLSHEAPHEAGLRRPTITTPTSNPTPARADELSILAFETAPRGIAVLSSTGTVVHANAAFCDFLGRSPESVIGMQHPGFPAALRGFGSQRPAVGLGVEIETSYTRPDGTSAWAHETVCPTAADPTGAERFVTIVRDISREKALEREARKFKYLSDETSEAHFLINRGGAIVYANNAAALITGYTRDALLRLKIAQVWDELPEARFGELFADASSRRVPGLQATFRRKDGTLRPVEINLFVSDFGGEQLLSALVGDRSEQQRVREALRESEARLRIAVDLAQLSVYGWDPVSGALSWDARLKAMWGLPPDAYVDYDVFWSGIHPDDKPLVDRAIKRTLDPADGFYQAEFRVVGLRDGVERWVAACGQTFFKDGKPVGYIGAALDITARKKNETVLEHAVAERTAELREVVTELESFSYSISHDMRAPLRAIQGFAQILEEECRDEVSLTGKEYIRRIVTAADRMDRLIQDALTYSRLTRQELPLENVDLASLVNGILEGYPQFQAPQAEITVQFPLPRVRGNVAALTQCVSNLIGNAVKFVPPGRTPKVRISAEVHGTRVRVAIKDNGIGIDPSVHEKIFQLFYRLDNQREGSGIGLAVARRAAHRMNGTISVVSQPGQGSTFTLELDAASWN